MSGDPEQEYFADGISEDLITAIATWWRFPVIARNSSFVYKGRPFDVKQVSQELGARYLLEGSVRKAGNRIRITAQLIDALTGHHVWADRYDRELGDIFAVQDEITTSIAAAVEPEIMEVEERRATTRRSFTVYDLVQRGNWHLYKFTPEGMAEAQCLFAAAIEADPNYAPAYTSMAYSKYMSAQFGADFEATLHSAFEFARKAVALDEKDARAHMFLGQTSLWLRRHDDAIAEARSAIALNPKSRSSLFRARLCARLRRGIRGGAEDRRALPSLAPARSYRRALHPGYVCCPVPAWNLRRGGGDRPARCHLDAGLLVGSSDAGRLSWSARPQGGSGAVCRGNPSSGAWHFSLRVQREASVSRRRLCPAHRRRSRQGGLGRLSELAGNAGIAVGLGVRFSAVQTGRYSCRTGGTRAGVSRGRARRAVRGIGVSVTFPAPSDRPISRQFERT